MSDAIPKPSVNLRIMFDGSTLYRLPGIKRTARYTPIQEQIVLMDDIGGGLSRDIITACDSPEEALLMASAWVLDGTPHLITG